MKGGVGVERRAVKLLRAAVVIVVTAALASAALAAEPQSGEVTFDQSADELKILVGGKPVATYVLRDERIWRPYFAHVHAPGGVQVTRNHPPVAGKDLPDHDTFHPGIWLSFGDVSGSDYWRIKAPVKFVKFTAAPKSGPQGGSFLAQLSYRDQQQPDKEVCTEQFRWELRQIPAGYLMLWDSTFSSDKEFYFGDQEEMGLGFRVATPLRVEQKSEDFPDVPAGNGEIVDSDGRRDEKEVWGNSADWCDYSGVTGGQRLGITIFCHPKNFRPSWFHARDYGLLEANPFGRAAFGKGEPSKIVVKPGDSLRLRYGVLVHASPADNPPDIAAAYRDYVKLTTAE